jgi:hypothetical protein
VGDCTHETGDCTQAAGQHTPMVGVQIPEVDRVEVQVGLDSNGFDRNDPGPNGPASDNLGLTGCAMRGPGLDGPVTSDADLDDLDVTGVGLGGPDASDFGRVFRLATAWGRASSRSLRRDRGICL